MTENSCEGCKWHDSFSWACCNGDSPYRADFVNRGCVFKEWEEEKMQIDKTSDSWLNCECLICGKKFHRKQSRIKKGEGKYCSIECHRIAKKEYMKGEKNHQYGLKGELNSSWNGGKKNNKVWIYFIETR